MIWIDFFSWLINLTRSEIIDGLLTWTFGSTQVCACGRRTVDEGAPAVRYLHLYRSRWKDSTNIVYSLVSNVGIRDGLGRSSGFKFKRVCSGNLFENYIFQPSLYPFVQLWKHTTHTHTHRLEVGTLMDDDYSSVMCNVCMSRFLLAAGNEDVGFSGV